MARAVDFGGVYMHHSGRYGILDGSYLCLVI